MTIGDMLNQLSVLLERGVITKEMPVLSDGCDCYGSARAVVVIQYADEGSPVPHLLISREEHCNLADGIRANDPAPKAPPPAPPPAPPRKFNTTEGNS